MNLGFEAVLCTFRSEPVCMFYDIVGLSCLDSQFEHDS